MRRKTYGTPCNDAQSSGLMDAARTRIKTSFSAAAGFSISLALEDVRRAVSEMDDSLHELASTLSG
jgi:hypothetical protein